MITVESQLPDDAEDRFPNGADCGILDSIEWYTCLVEFGFATKPDIRVYVNRRSERNGAADAALLLRADTKSRRLCNLTGPYSLYHRQFLPAGSDELERAQAFGAFIAAERPRWTELQFRNLAGWSAGNRDFGDALARSGYRIVWEHQKWNWHANVENISFSQFSSARPGALRATLRRKRRQIERTGELRFDIVTGGEELPRAIADYQRVYAASWKPGEFQGEFVVQLMRLCASRGELRLGLLYLDDKPVAAQFWILSQRTAYIYKLAHDRRFDSYSVGSLLSESMFKHAIDEDNVGNIDFGTGNETYKRDWMDERRQIVTLRAVSTRTIRGAALWCRIQTREALRSLGLIAHTAVAEPETGPK